MVTMVYSEALKLCWRGVGSWYRPRLARTCPDGVECEGRNGRCCATPISVAKSLSPAAVHSALIELTRSMARLIRKVWKNTIHTDPVLVPRESTSHVCPVPLQCHWHFPEILWNVVEGLVELAHARHGVDVGADAVYITTSRHW